MTEREQPLRQLLDAYRAAVRAKDVDAFVALYDRETRVFDMWGQWEHNGVDAWRVIVADWFGSIDAGWVTVDRDDVQTMVVGEVAIASAFVTYRAMSPEGKVLRTMNNRLTWALRWKDGTWKIVHEHTSAPVDFETSKVILQR